MPPEIDFPDVDPQYIFENDCLAFRALVDGKPIECMVTVELLMARFGAREPTEQSMRQAYRQHRDEIQRIARDHIENGWIDDKRRVFLTTQFTDLNVSYGAELQERPREFTQAQAAWRILAELIGPGSGEINLSFEWEERGSRSIIAISLADNNDMVFDWIDANESSSESRLRFRMARLVGDFFQKRSHRLLQRLG